MWTPWRDEVGQVAVMADKDRESLSLVDTLRLIVQSQLVLSELQTNQKRLESLIEDLEKEVPDDKPR